MFDVNLRKEIKKKLIDVNMSQTELAKKIGTSLSYVNQLLCGRVENLKLETLILEELNIDDTRTTSR